VNPLHSPEEQQLMRDPSFMEYYNRYPKYNTMPISEQIRFRDLFRHKYDTLRANYSNMNIPQFPENKDLVLVHMQYDHLIARTWQEHTSLEYREYLIYFWCFLEVITVKALGMNMGGYAEFQMMMMSKYDRVLIELGEKYPQQQAIGVESSMSPEYKLIFISLLQAAIFWGIKYGISCITENPQVATRMQDAIFNLVSKGIRRVDEQGQAVGGAIPPGGAPPPQISELGRTFTSVVNTITGGRNGESGGFGGIIGSLFGAFRGARSAAPATSATQDTGPRLRPAFDE
jgi:hypothetical protein